MERASLHSGLGPSQAQAKNSVPLLGAAYRLFRGKHWVPKGIPDLLWLPGAGAFGEQQGGRARPGESNSGLRLSTRPVIQNEGKLQPLSDPGSLETCLSLVGGGDQEAVDPAVTPTVCQATC